MAKSKKKVVKNEAEMPENPIYPNEVTPDVAVNTRVDNYVSPEELAEQRRVADEKAREESQKNSEQSEENE